MCNIRFERSRSQWQRDLKSRNQTLFYCSPACASAARRNPVLEATCEECGENFTRPAGGPHDALRFCSRSHANRYNNRKRRGERTVEQATCSLCGVGLNQPRAGGMCRQCRAESTRISRESTRIGNLRTKYGYAQFHAKLRGWSRSSYTGPWSCALCGYALHVDVCHIKAVHKFKDSATVGEVNAASNLVALCKNHHWEFDNGHISLEEIMRHLESHSRSSNEKTTTAA